MVKLVKLGNSDLEVPIICLGTMTWGNQNTEEEAWEQMDYCMEKGVNFFDTAELYPVPPQQNYCGKTEEFIGTWMKARNNRDKIILATKVCGNLGPCDRSFIVANRSDPALQVAPEPILDDKNIREALAASLRRMQTTYVDLYQLHWPDRYAPLWGGSRYDPTQERENGAAMEETVATIGQLIKEGLIKYWGVSNESTYGVARLCEIAKATGVPLPISIQNDFCLMCRQFEGELAEACAPRHYNMGLLAYGALAGGTLSGKYSDPENMPKKGRHVEFPAFQSRYHQPRTMVAVNKYVALAKEKGITSTQLSLAWCKTRWYMASVIIGATSMEQLRECIDAFDVDLDEDTLKAIDEIHMEHRNPMFTD